MTRLHAAVHRAWDRTRIARELLLETIPPAAMISVFGGIVIATGSPVLAVIAAVVVVVATDLWLTRRDERRNPR